MLCQKNPCNNAFLRSGVSVQVWRLGRNVTALELGCGNGQLSYSLTLDRTSCSLALGVSVEPGFGG